MSHRPLAAGHLDRRVRIEQKSVARDANFGSESITWVTLATVWARVDEAAKASGAESVTQSTRTLTRTATVMVRYRSDLTSDMRIVLLDRGNRLLQIMSMAETGRREGLELVCEDYSV